jgi:hypothetical protein
MKNTCFFFLINAIKKACEKHMLFKKFVLFTCLKDICMPLLYVDCIKSFINRFVRNFCHFIIFFFKKIKIKIVLLIEETSFKEICEQYLNMSGQTENNVDIVF